jgi:hypothetical protein
MNSLAFIKIDVKSRLYWRGNAAIWQNMKFLVVLDEPIDQLPGNADSGGNLRKIVFCKPVGANDF